MFEFEFFTVTAIGLLAIISPGPDFAIVTKTSLVEGRRAGFGSAMGIAVANLGHVAINLLGIGWVIAQSVTAFTVMKILGALYLLYIGFKGLRAKPEILSPSNPVHTKSGLGGATHASLRKGFSMGLLTCLLNPKACLFFLSFFSVVISSETPFVTQVFYGAWISALALAWFLLVAFFFTNPHVSAKLKRSKHWIDRITGGALMLLGLRLLTAKAAS